MGGMKKALNQEFFNRPVLEVAPELLGKFLTRKNNGKETALMITDIEAYDGLKDRASHCRCGQTERNKIMFGEAGHWYVYFTYGIHWMLNAVTGPAGYPAAVLIRGTEEIYGPARITKFLKVNKKLNGFSIERKSGLWIEDRGIKIAPDSIERCKRVGVDYAGQWADKLYRFKITHPSTLLVR
ncbi:DNA-3-methyladenine glycosylase [Patescibacteria group bacterium]